MTYTLPTVSNDPPLPTLRCAVQTSSSNFGSNCNLISSFVMSPRPLLLLHGPYLISQQPPCSLLTFIATIPVSPAFPTPWRTLPRSYPAFLSTRLIHSISSCVPPQEVSHRTLCPLVRTQSKTREASRSVSVRWMTLICWRKQSTL